MSWLWNVRLETGERIDEHGRVRTVTELYHISMKNGLIEDIVLATSIEPNNTGYDAKGKLLLPAFKDFHNHLDKTYLSLAWKACIPSHGLSHRLQLEAKELSELATSAEVRAATMIEKLISNGVNHIRSHVNIDPFIKLENLHGIKKALDSYSDYITYEIVAFPQHGLLNQPEVANLLRESFQNGATLLGALDPGGIDKDIERSLQMTMDIAKQCGVDVDMHFHDRGNLGYYTMDKWMDMVEEQGYTGKTAFSHAFGIAGIHGKTLDTFSDRLLQHKVEILTTAPIGLRSQLIPIDHLRNKGVFVGMGCDGFYDSWSPYVAGDVLEKLNHFCEYTGKTSERELRNSLGLVTGGITPLNKEAKQVWPNIDDEASFVLINASCSAEAIARVSDQNQRILIHQGNIYDKEKMTSL